MPGPSNTHKGKKARRASGKKPRASIESTASSASSTRLDIRTPSPDPAGGALDVTVVVASLDDAEEHDNMQLPEDGYDFKPQEPPLRFADPEFETDAQLDAFRFNPERPFIHDPGNGHRVRSMAHFLPSFFAQPPALPSEDPLAAEFASEEVREMLLLLCNKGGVLTEEMALALWYNKSRATSRVCPACQRLYRLGDVLPEHVDDESDERPWKTPPPQLEREQQISGLCSSLCFILASYNYPAAIKYAWGTMADEMDEEVWTLLNTSPEGPQPPESIGLGMLVRMTRLHDLGLAQLVLHDDDDID
ncbi:hypothetical protein MIND_00955400 [Mycena indigotica]|uniref:Uncharacterized protein n=1 Tax=Mycena indigotica TaxID=2126181 RepID=A0A8H6SD18_9AGAR|nr:uncharacterized protein MIND_00955400 [Mycena indigotica]KAF7297223.1 hypothetical protein MIND_00955400 [Mycena indigotica]